MTTTPEAGKKAYNRHFESKLTSGLRLCRSEISDFALSLLAKCRRFSMRADCAAVLRHLYETVGFSEHGSQCQQTEEYGKEENVYFFIEDFQQKLSTRLSNN